MAISLTVDFTIPNGKRLIVERARPNDEDTMMSIDVTLRTTAATDHVVSRKSLEVRNGLCDRLVRNPALSAGAALEQLIQVEPRALTLATGYTDAMAAWRGGANPNARRAALEAWCLASGVIDSSLSGT